MHLGARRGPAYEWWLILFAKKSPYQVTFLQLRPRLQPLLGAGDLALDPDVWTHQEFDYFPLVVRFEDQLGFDDCDDLFILEGVTVRGKYASAARQPVAFDIFAAALPLGRCV